MSQQLSITGGADGGEDDRSLLVDALPYIDAGYDEHAKQAALALIEAECKRFPPSTDYVSHLPPPESIDKWSTPVLRAESERVAGRQPMHVLSMRRYELPGPSAARLTDVAAWGDAANNARAQLQHQHARVTNLEVMCAYGPHAWRSYNGTLERVARGAEQQVRTAAAQVQEVHVRRKHMQTDAGGELKLLERQWVQLVTKNFQIESACVDLESELAPMRKRHKSQGDEAA